MNREVFEHEQLFAGEVDYITPVSVDAGTFKRGDLIVTADGVKWAKATADTAIIANHFAVCAEDKTLDEAGEIVTYKQGYFNRKVLKINDAEATDEIVEMLKTKNIFIKNVG